MVSFVRGRGLRMNGDNPTGSHCKCEDATSEEGQVLEHIKEAEALTGISRLYDAIGDKQKLQCSDGA